MRECFECVVVLCALGPMRASCHAEVVPILSGSDLSPEEASKLLRKFLLKEYGSGSLSAQKLCIVSHYITRSNGTGVEDLGYRPGDSSGNYQKHLDCILGLDAWNENLLELQMPGYCKHSDSRNLTFIPTWANRLYNNSPMAWPTRL